MAGLISKRVNEKRIHGGVWIPGEHVGMFMIFLTILMAVFNAIAWPTEFWGPLLVVLPAAVSVYYLIMAGNGRVHTSRYLLRLLLALLFLVIVIASIWLSWQLYHTNPILPA